MAKIYVSNLPLTTSKAQLSELFEKWGPYSVIRFPTDRLTGRCRGYGVVDLKNDKASEAVNFLGGLEFEGQTLMVAPLDGC
ncbi:MAG: RNA-binding protein [Deltaproteobacteria bacterium]|nr:RNA-binding protein [Deltaproteobacteria bacterium]